MAVDLRGSYFSIGNPLARMFGWLHPYKYRQTVSLNGHTLQVSWTHRAETALRQRSQPLLVEMQLYFSCVVQKRVLFCSETEQEYVPVSDNLKVCFRPVEALSCDPEQFAAQHPVKRQLSSRFATRMFPARLSLDHVKGQWQGEFSI
ncbi:hypothetical protein [Sulfuriflexus mobilis]|uniref:hypothetical protein n=1 Tax=Sulfuriflexus mobilis TaxID=1811807 RepID=UPI000F839D0F|nr:hypothetical protein [Sulfuriflexus mobilis]